MPGFNPHPPETATNYVQALYGHPSPFPPSFDGNPWSYAFGLFGDVVAASLALTMLLVFVFERRRHRQIHIILGNHASQDVSVKPWSPLWLYRSGMMCFLSFVVMRTMPDAVWMLAWGEVNLQTIEFMLAADLIADGLSVVPLLFAAVFWAWGRQVITQKLSEGGQIRVTGAPPWDVIRKNLKIVVVVFIIAILVTIGKSSG